MSLVEDEIAQLISRAARADRPQGVPAAAGEPASVIRPLTTTRAERGALVPTAAELAIALLAADEIHFPDPKQATAGIHFAKVLDALGIAEEVASGLKTFANGATA